MHSRIAPVRHEVIDFLTRKHLLDLTVAGISGAMGATRAATGVDRKIAREYLATARSPKLQIGCGGNPRPGWLNSDLFPRKGVMRLDATKRFPFPTGTFDLVYSEHMIEHISLANGVRMLAECYRVMRPGATMRLATPDLTFLIRLLREPDKPLHRAYVDWSVKIFGSGPLTTPRVTVGGQRLETSGVVVNSFLRDWNHTFIYDEPTLRQVVGGIGFVETTRRGVDESGVPELKGLDNIERMPEGFLELESLILEFRKPE